MNPLTAGEKKKIKDWANLQYAISRKHGDKPVKSSFYRGRSVGAGKIAKQYNPFYGRRGGFGGEEVRIGDKVYRQFKPGSGTIITIEGVKAKVKWDSGGTRRYYTYQLSLLGRKNPKRFDPILESLNNEEEEEMIGVEINPRPFSCSICGQSAPKKLLEHSKFTGRMDWLRHHYQRKHPTEFKTWGKNPGVIRAVTNPIFETIGSAAITGVGIGAGFKTLDLAWGKLGLPRAKKNPATYFCHKCNKWHKLKSKIGRLHYPWAFPLPSERAKKLHLYQSPLRLVKDRLEMLHRTQFGSFTIYKDAIEDAIQDKKKGKVPRTGTLRSLTLTELESALRFANRLYR